MHKMSMEPPIIAVIGCGLWGQNLIRNFARLGVLHAICDVDIKQARILSKRFQVVIRAFDDILKDPSITAIVLATPPQTHTLLAERALTAGKHVWVEKPLSLEIEGAVKLDALAKKQNLCLMVGHIMHYHPGFAFIKNFAENKMGKIIKIESSRLSRGYTRQEGVLWDFAPHDLSMILQLVPHTTLSECLIDEYAYIDNTLQVLKARLWFQEIECELHFSWVNAQKVQSLCIVGDAGMLIFDDTEVPERKCQFYPINQDSNEGPQFLEYSHEEPLKLECEHFIDCIMNKAPPKSDGREAILGLSIISHIETCLKQIGPATPLLGQAL